jgi:hypothetical protein
VPVEIEGEKGHSPAVVGMEMGDVDVPEVPEIGPGIQERGHHIGRYFGEEASVHEEAVERVPLVYKPRLSKDT